MKELIEAIFGQYQAITYYVSEVIDGEEVVNEVIPNGMAGVDWTYVLGVFGFFLVLYCIMRIIGSVISKC